MSKRNIARVLLAYSEYCITRNEIYKGKVRKPNFPEDVSESLVKFYIEKYENIPTTGDIRKGDLLKSDGTVVEVKAFQSNTPNSYGPTECWDELYIVDLRQFLEDILYIYKIPYSNDSEEIKNLKVNRKQTYRDQCLQGRRPRITTKNLIKQLDGEFLIYKGNITSLLAS